MANPTPVSAEGHPAVRSDPSVTDSSPGLSVEALADGPTWKHHDRYFPAFSEADFFSSPSIPLTPISKSGVTTTSPGSAYTFTSPFEDALTVVEAQALEHAKLSGRNVVLHYPALPAFEEFLSGKSRESVGWKEPQWGTEGWTGYGWSGEVLPGKGGMTFGAPMPEGLPLNAEGEAEKVPAKKEAPAAGGGGGGDEAKDEAGEGGGGGKKKKKK